ncbi:MAG: hypothetical protein M3011_05595 [Actinomycetota bacterium]|nr:hypothetical protein [Actinomycetota bacterium]
MATAGTRMLAFVAATTLVTGAACGGGSDTPTAADDKATAERIVLTSADLPGFTPEPADKSDSPSPMDRCTEGILEGKAKRPAVDGLDFTKDEGNLRVQSTANLAGKESEARDNFSKVKGIIAGQCVKDGLRETVKTSIDPGVSVGDVTYTSMPAPKLTDDSSLPVSPCRWSPAPTG